MREKKVCSGGAGMISVQNVSKNYGPLRVLHNLSFEVRKGEVLGFLGPNGAGKTTVMRILTGFFPPTEGKVVVAGVEVSRAAREFKKHIGYLPERLFLYPDLRVEEFLDFVAQIKGVPRKERKRDIEEKMSLCGAESVAKRKIGHLSKGFLQRVGLAQALLGDPAILVLDEPTSGLDPRQIIEIRELIRLLGRDRTLILSTHILPEVSAVCERVLILNQGRIVAQGRPDDLEKRLRDRREVLVRVRNQGEEQKKESVGQVLLSIPGVESLQKLAQEDSVSSFLLTTTLDDDLRSDISKRLVEAGFPLLEISTKRLSLEDIFLKLVVSEEPVEAA